jgi:hypothetical protein
MGRHLTPASGVLLLVLTGTVSNFESLAKKDNRVRDHMVVIFSSMNVFNVYRHER